MFNKLGQNITPDKLRVSTTKEIFETCNKYLTDIANILEAETIIAVGKYAHKMAKIAINNTQIKTLAIKEIPHPSPANPLANKDKGRVWKKIAKEVIKK
jgi:single-strand selective monofunctional uracil DNA glycosylase